MCTSWRTDFITLDLQGKYEMIQVVWDITDPQTLERETRALKAAERELGFSGRLIDYKSYISQYSQRKTLL